MLQQPIPMEFQRQAIDSYLALEDFDFDFKDFHDSNLDTQAHIEWDSDLFDVKPNCSDANSEQEQGGYQSSAEGVRNVHLSLADEFTTLDSIAQFGDQQWTDFLAENFAGDNDNMLPELGSADVLDFDYSEFLTNDESDLSVTPQGAASDPKNQFRHEDSTPACEDAIEAGPWPSQLDWERFRELITRLYAVEDKPLHLVMSIMERDHAHKGT
jgi:hypothetical protein